MSQKTLICITQSSLIRFTYESLCGVDTDGEALILEELIRKQRLSRAFDVDSFERVLPQIRADELQCVVVDFGAKLNVNGPERMRRILCFVEERNQLLHRLVRDIGAPQMEMSESGALFVDHIEQDLEALVVEVLVGIDADFVQMLIANVVV